MLVRLGVRLVRVSDGRSVFRLGVVDARLGAHVPRRAARRASCPGAGGVTDSESDHVVGTSGSLASSRIDVSWIGRGRAYVAGKWFALTHDWPDMEDDE